MRDNFKIGSLNKKEIDVEIKLENNLKYFDLQKKHKGISKNVLKFIKLVK